MTNGKMQYFYKKSLIFTSNSVRLQLSYTHINILIIKELYEMV